MQHDSTDEITTASPLRTDGLSGYRFPLELLPAIRVDRNPDYLIKGLLPSGSLVVLYGRSGTGKSFIGLDAALHVAAGRNWAGCRVRQAGVVYIASEGGIGMRRRVVAARRHHGMDASVPFALVTVAPDLGQRDGDADRLADEILAQVPAGFRPGLVVLDTLARSMVGGDETGASGMGIFIHNAARLGRALGATIMPIHHMGKDASAGMRGSSALLSAADAVWEIDPEQPGLMRLIKMKEDADNLRFSFALERVVIDHDSDGDPITSCVVSIGAAAPGGAEKTAPVPEEPPAPSLPPASRLFHEALRAVIAAHGTEAGRRFRRIPSCAKTIRQAELEHHAEVLAITGSSVKSRRSSIDRQIRTLEQFKLVSRRAGLVWLLDSASVTLNDNKPLAA